MDALPNLNEPGCDYSPPHGGYAMNRRAVGYEIVVFVTQWGLMLLGFGLLTKFVAPLKLLNPSLSLGLYFDAGAKALIALVLSVAWLFIWDRQVRLYFHRRGR
jgi:hypothetical protein